MTDVQRRPPVLIVEDDPDIQHSLVEICRDLLGLDPLTAASAEAALALIEARRPAVVLLDLCLPDHDGAWLAGEIAARGLGGELRLVVLSAQSGVEGKAGSLGAFAFLAKPFSLADVIETLEKALKP